MTKTLTAAGRELGLEFSPPAPWVVNDDDEDDIVVECHAYEDECPEVCRGSNTWPLTIEAARLIAAAPQLLSAARKVLAGLEALIDAAPSTAKPVFDGIADLHAAIGHATKA